MVPANQLGPILQGIANAAKNIGEQIQFKADDDDGKATTSPKKAAAPKKAAPKKRSTSK